MIDKKNTKMSNLNKNIYQCNLCETIFSDKGNFWRHTHKKYACISLKQCLQLMQNVDDLKEQLKIQSEQVKYLQMENELIKTRGTSDDQSNRTERFIQYLKKNNFQDAFIDIFEDKEVSYTTVQKFMLHCHKKRNVSSQQKKQICFDQNYICLKCDKRVISLEIDHIIALYRGGSNTLTNLQGLCAGCHAKKTIRESIDFNENIQLAYDYYFK